MEPTIRRIGNLTLVVADPKALGLVSFADGPKTTRDAVRSTLGLIAAVDGPMFGFCSTERRRDYANYSCGSNRFKLFYPDRFIAIPGTTPNDGSTLSVVNGVAVWNPGANVPNGADFAVQLYPTLISNGVVTRGLSDLDTNKRVAVGVMEDGSVFLAYHPRVSMPDLAAALKSAGAKHAGYTDGGGSAAMWVDTNLDGNPEFSANLVGRRVISWITLERKTLFDSVGNKVLTVVGGKGQVLGAILAVVVGLSAAIATSK